MIGYKDMTFCTFYKSCSKAKECHRPLYPRVQKAAEKWATRFFPEGVVPIMIFNDRPDCHEEKQNGASNKGRDRGDAARLQTDLEDSRQG